MGLYDRGYMRRNGASYGGSGGMSVIWKLIGVNAVIYLAAATSAGIAGQLVLTGESIRAFQIYRVVTAAFLHVDFWHIFLNMWGLYLFGSLVSLHLNGGKVAGLYLAGGIMGNLLFLAFHWNSYFALLGASGAVYGITIAAAMLEPDRRFMLIFMPFRPIKTSTMVVVFTVIEVLSTLGSSDGIAHLAHLGGFIGGYLYLKALRIPLAWDPLRKLFTGGAPVFRQENKHYDNRSYRNPGGENFTPGRPVPQREVDRLLDKISDSGINSLSEEELATLRRIREQMNHPGR